MSGRGLECKSWRGYLVNAVQYEGHRIDKRIQPCLLDLFLLLSLYGEYLQMQLAQT